MFAFDKLKWYGAFLYYIPSSFFFFFPPLLWCFPYIDSLCLLYSHGHVLSLILAGVCYTTVVVSELLPCSGVTLRS